jgi:hypothetical protein
MPARGIAAAAQSAKRRAVMLDEEILGLYISFTDRMVGLLVDP